MENLEIYSCTDEPCIWKNNYKKCVEKYQATPLSEIESFKIIPNNIIINNNLQSEIKDLVRQKLPNSAWTKHCIGRHEGVILNKNNDYELNEKTKEEIKEIFKLQLRSPLHDWLKKIKIPILPCCEKFLSELGGDFVEIRTKTRVNFSAWKKARKYRITGSKCYELYTYTKNKKPDWYKKSKSVFDPIDFKNEYTEHGVENEGNAGKKFIEITGFLVIEIGLVVSIKNAIFGYSADGVIIFNGIPWALFEAKCVHRGKFMNVYKAIFTYNEKKKRDELINYLEQVNEGFKLKKNHKYYGQVQLGMFILNVPIAYFVVYASYDDSILIIKVDFDFEFVRDMLEALKNAYYKNIVHNLHDKNDNNNN